MLAGLLPGGELDGLEPGKGESERLGEICPHRGTHEVGQLKRGPRRLQDVTGERGPRLLQCLDDLTGGGFDGDALRGKRAAPVRGTERVVRFELFVQACPDEHVIKYARVALQRPQRAALDQAGRDTVQLGPALQATVGLNDGFLQIGHRSFFRLSIQPAAGLRTAPPGCGRTGYPAARGVRWGPHGKWPSSPAPRRVACPVRTGTWWM